MQKCVPVWVGRDGADVEEAQVIAQQFGCAHVLIESHELDDPNYQANTPLRCYFCKHEVYGELVEYARQHDFQLIIDGTNLDDLGDVRPGRKAAAEYGVRSPLIETQFTKQDVRDLARAIGYTFVALDLVGYRLGSLNELIKANQA